MRITVKLFSTLRSCVLNYDPEKGLPVELPAGATAADLLKQMEIPCAKAPVVSSNGRILKSTDSIVDQSEVQIFQPVMGG